MIAFEPASDCTLLVRFGDEISLAMNDTVRRLLMLLRRERLPGVYDLHPAYSSLLIKFDPLRYAHEDLAALLHPLLARLDEITLPPPSEVEIPVCYGGEYGPDLEDVARLVGLTAEQVIEQHAAARYLVYFLGFVPGFAFLGGLPAALAAPRLSSPRKEVPAGSVGIGGQQTGVYPFATPGGWQLIGRTSLTLFRPEMEPMSLLQSGDWVRFRPIPPEEFAA